MFGPFSDPRVAVRVGRVFGNASERVRERRQASAEREGLGQRARREDSDTDDLIHDFETAVTAEVEGLSHELAPGVHMGVEFHATNFPVAEENRYGADFGVRLHMEGPSFNIAKAVLFQSKRAYGSGESTTFDQLRGDGEAQARRMLAVTPASFFLLFNGLPVSTVGEWIKPSVAWWPLGEDFPWPGPFRWAELNTPPFSLWNTGVMVLPATRVLAESRARRPAESLPTAARHWLRASMPLGLFMADMFGSCFVGDVRDEVVRLVTPPALRNMTGGPSGDPTLLPVRRLMNLTIRSEQG